MSQNVTSLNILNTSEKTQTFRAVLFDGQGNRADGFPIIGEAVPPMARVILTSEDLEKIFDVPAWSGPALLEVSGQGSFDLMSKLANPSGLESNTNCVREDRVLSLEGLIQKI